MQHVVKRRPFPVREWVALIQLAGALAGLAGYFCQVRFLWRLARSFFRRLCLLIFAFRRFFSEPIINYCIPAHRPGSASATHLRLPAILCEDQPIVLSHHTVRE
jgi:hypothetical protein